MVDNHPTECKTMELFKQGESETASQVQDEFLKEIFASGEDLCSCPYDCKFHGKCIECVMIHRGHGDHLPNCFRDMVNKRITAISELTEHSFKQTK